MTKNKSKNGLLISNFCETNFSSLCKEETVTHREQMKNIN